MPLAEVTLDNHPAHRKAAQPEPVTKPDHFALHIAFLVLAFAALIAASLYVLWSARVS
jgi:hypothetical protein